MCVCLTDLVSDFKPYVCFGFQSNNGPEDEISEADLEEFCHQVRSSGVQQLENNF